MCSTASEQPTGQPGLTSKAEEESKGKGKGPAKVISTLWLIRCYCNTAPKRLLKLTSTFT